MRKLNKSARYKSDDKNQKDHNVTVVDEEQVGPSTSNEDQPGTSQNQPDQSIYSSSFSFLVEMFR